MPLYLVSVEGEFTYKLEGSFSVEAGSKAEAERIGADQLNNGTADIAWEGDRVLDQAVQPHIITEVEVLADGDEDIRDGLD